MGYGGQRYIVTKELERVDVGDEARSKQGKKEQRKGREGLKLEDQENSHFCYPIFLA